MPAFHFSFALSSSGSTYERWRLVDRLLPSNRTPMIELPPGLGSATTTPVRILVLGLREMPNSLNRTRSPNSSSIVIWLSPSARRRMASNPDRQRSLVSSCWGNPSRNVRMRIIRGTPSRRAEIGGEGQARKYDEPNGEPAHASLPGV